MIIARNLVHQQALIGIEGQTRIQRTVPAQSSIITYFVRLRYLY